MYTKGKWEVVMTETHPHYEVVVKNEPKWFYVASITDHHNGEVEANARLIAAAPELLEALVEAETYIKEILLSEKKNYGSNGEYDLEIYKQIQQALAEAEK